jgi:hypothetical protein
MINYILNALLFKSLPTLAQDDMVEAFSTRYTIPT